MRRAVLTFALLASLAVPAGAGADALTVGRQKLDERVAAECGRHGLAATTGCATGPGQAEVDAHRGTALARVLAFQRALGDRLAFADAQWVGTHNSYNTPAEDPTLSHTDSNQQLTPVQQLDVDVRSLELDVHWMPTHRDGGGLQPVVCHGQGPAGCTTERTLAAHLRDLAGWLGRPENAGEVVLLYLEDQIAIPPGPDVPARYARAAEVVERTLGSRVYAPRGEGCRDLPLDLTRDAVRAAGRQVVVVGGCGQGAWQGVSHAWPASVRFEARPRGWRCSDLPSQPRIVRYFEDSTFLAQTPASSADDGLTPATVRLMVECGVDLLGFDQLVPGDGRLEATAWSWAADVPSPGTPAVQRADGRWAPATDGAARPAACRRTEGGWVLTVPVPHGDAAAACAGLGASFDPPRTGAENAALRDAHDGAGAWIGWEAATPAAATRTATARGGRPARRCPCR